MQGEVLCLLPWPSRPIATTEGAARAEGQEDGGLTDSSDPVCAPSLPQDGLGVWAEAMVPFGHADGWQQDAFGTVSSLESSPSCCHLSVLEGVVFGPVGCAKLWGRGEKQCPEPAVLDPC